MEETNENVVEQATEQPIEEVVEQKTESQPRNEKGQFTSKTKVSDDGIIKVDLSKPPQVKEEVVEEKENIVKEEAQEEVPVMEEITVDDLKEPEAEKIIEETVVETPTAEEPLPENIQKVVDFMKDTGGDLNDYVNLNRDVSEMDDSEVLDEYYRNTKSHLSPEERSYLLEDSFGIDEEADDDKTIRMKKIALKEQVAEAKAYLDGQKSKYYEEIKAGSKLTEEQQKAIDFFNRYNKESEEQKKLSEASKKTFLNKTNNLFNEKFKGFEYNVGDKKYRFNVKDVDKVKTTQSDINNFVNKFVGEDKTTIDDAVGYHKSLFTAMNADTIAKHFYEQGKADAIKNSIARDKNINTGPRQTHGEANIGGMKIRALGESSSEMKNRSFKIRKRNN
jgi:hypothetical protein